MLTRLLLPSPDAGPAAGVFWGAEKPEPRAGESPMGKGDNGCTCCLNMMAGLPAGMGTLWSVGAGSSLLIWAGESAPPAISPSALPAFLLVDGGTCTE